jgi:CBS domain-containing protein
MGTRNLPIADAGPLVADLMLRTPRTVAPETTVAEARVAFENAKERMLLVARDGRFVGAVRRDVVTGDVDSAAPLAELLDADAPRVGPSDSAAHAIELLEQRQTERLPVVEPDGTLIGLVCFNPKRQVFCVDH